MESLFRKLPSVDRLLKNQAIIELLNTQPPSLVKEAINETLNTIRERLKRGEHVDIIEDRIIEQAKSVLSKKYRYSLRTLINATGVVIHTNLGRSILPKDAIEHIIEVSTRYSNLEYDLEEGARGKRYSHIVNAIKRLLPVEAALVVNNNAAAVFLTLNTLAKGKEVIVSRGELVEIGGSFRIPDVMANSGAVLREVGTTNKTHLRDYENAINENTALLLKVHQSNFRIIGFTTEVSLEEVVELGRKRGIPVMVDLGSGCFIDLRKYGIGDEPTVEETLSKGADIVTFSGDKLLGSAQAGFILGKAKYLEKIAQNPLMRAVRVDKMTLAALEATLRLYLDENLAIEKIPTLRMILERPENIRKRAQRIARLLRKEGIDAQVLEDISMPGGGSLPEVGVKTYVVSIVPPCIPQNYTKILRNTEPPVIARIKNDKVLLDARTIQEDEITPLVRAVKEAFKSCQ